MTGGTSPGRAARSDRRSAGSGERDLVTPARGPLFSPLQGRLTIGELWLLFGFAVMFVHPVSRNWLIFPLYAVSALVGLWRFGHRPDRSWAPLAIGLVVVVGVVLTVIGLLRGTPGAERLAVPLVFGPAVFYAIGLGLDRQVTRYLPWVVGFATGLLGASLLVVAFAGPKGWMFWLDPFVGSLAADGGYAVRAGAIGSLAGLLPFVVFYQASQPRLRGPASLAFVVAGSLGAAAALVSNRLAVVLVTFLALLASPLVRVVALRSTGRGASTRRALPGAYVFVVVVLLIVAALSTFTEYSLTEATRQSLAKVGLSQGDSSTDALVRSDVASSELRKGQASALLDGFFESPLLGKGSGSFSPEVVRNEERPWEYELQYHLLLFSNGLFGAGLYVAAVALGVWEIRARWPSADDRTRRVTIGAIGAAGGMLVANATNPYLQAVGQQWALFLPVMVICARDRLGEAEPTRR